MNHDVFISYSRKDKEIVSLICKLLDGSHISYWLDTHDIHVGNEFMRDIVEAIKACKITLFVSSSESNRSLYTAKEVALAFNEGKHIIPYRIDDSNFNTNLQLLFSDINCVDAIPFSEAKAILLVNDIAALLKGDRGYTYQTVEERPYIDVSTWEEPQNKFIKFITHLFREK